MADQLAVGVGERVRFHRLAGRKTQAVVAGLSGITTDYLYQIERGKKLPTLPVLIAIAKALDVPMASLVAEPAEVVTAHTLRATGGNLHRAMTMPTAAGEESLPLADLRVQVDGAWRLWQSSPTRYSQVGSLLGDLIVESERALRAAAGTELAPATNRLAADLYGLTRTFAKRSGRADLAFVAADRAYRAAEASGDMLRLGVARWNLAHAALTERQDDVAEDIAMTTADELGDSFGPDGAAVCGSLVLVASSRPAWCSSISVRTSTSVSNSAPFPTYHRAPPMTRARCDVYSGCCDAVGVSSNRSLIMQGP